MKPKAAAIADWSDLGVFSAACIELRALAESAVSFGYAPSEFGEWCASMARAAKMRQERELERAMQRECVYASGVSP